MAQVLPPNCPRCGQPTAVGMSICAKCGLPAEAMLAPVAATQPPYAPQPADVAARPSGAQAPSSQPGFVREDQQTAWRTSAPQTQRRPRSRAAVVLVLVALLLVLGVVIYVAAGLLGLSLPGFKQSQSAITTTPLQLTFQYEGANATLVNAQRAQNFLDDPNTHGDGMLRLNLQAANTTTTRIAWSYQDIAQLVLPGNAIIEPVYVKGSIDIAPGKTQSNIVDFAVPSSDTLSKLTLRLGAASEAQLNIPLDAKADLKAYQPVETQLNGQAVYFGVNWTLDSAASSLSIPGKQAAKGMRYVILTLSVDNTLSQTAITGSPYDYARLTYAGKQAVPVDSTLPVSFQSGANGLKGTLSFLVPQKSTTFTLLFLPQAQDSGDTATIPFQIPV